MSNQGVRGFYQITKTIKDELLTDENINTVTTGDITEIDMSKQTIFPLAHMTVNNVVQQENVLSFNISVFTMDLVDESKNETVDVFLGNDNEHDVLNTMLSVQTKLIQTLRFGNLYKDEYQLEGDPTCEPFKDRFENLLAGWVSTFNVLIDNDVNVCD